MFDEDFFVCPKCKMLKSTRKSLQTLVSENGKVYIIKCRCGWMRTLEKPPKIFKKKKKVIFS